MTDDTKHRSAPPPHTQEAGTAGVTDGAPSDRDRPMKLEITKEWFEKRAAAEGDSDPTTGRRKTMTINLTEDEIAELERLVNPKREAIRVQAFEEAALHVRKAADAYVAETGIEYSGGIIETAFEAGARWALHTLKERAE